MTAIEAKDLSKTYLVYRKPRDWLVERLTFGMVERARKIRALHDISLSLDEGKTLGIIGPNGAGKTTLLKVMTGLVRPTSGELKINGSVASFLELGSGFHPEFTGRQNVRLNCSILGLSPGETAARSEEIIEFSELGEAIDDPVRTYSAGMFMRLGFSVAASFKPDVLVVDEILSVGDEYFMGKCLGRLNDFKAAGRAIVMVSHDLALVRHLCDEALLLDKGHAIARGAPDDVADRYLDSVYETSVETMKPFSTDAPEPESGVRRGSGEALITETELIGPSGKATTVLETGKPFKVRIFFKANEPVRDALFGFNIFRADGVLLVSTNHTLGHGPASLPALAAGQTATAVFECDNLPLLQGAYSLGVSIFHGDRPFPMPIDEIMGAVKFNVQQGRMKEKGQMRLPGKWRFHP